MANGQSDTIVTDTIGILANRLNINNSQNIKTAHIINAQSQILDNVLQSHSGVFVKTYGAGSISTISMRGGSSSQTLISWNGIPINNPMLGLNDLSLIPMQSFQNIQIIKGGNTTKFGSGAMTGVIDISTQHNLNKKFGVSVNTNIASFNSKSIGSTIDFNHKNLAVQATYQNTSADNDFPYSTLSGDSKTQTHAYTKSETATLSTYYLLNSQSHLKFNYWHQNTFRQIPPTTVQTRSLSNLHDIINRYNLSYEFNNNNISVKSNFAYLNEQNNFRDSTNLIFTNNRFESLINKTDASYSTNNNLEFQFGYILSSITAQTAFYETNQTLNNLGLYSGINFNKGRNTINFSARKEWHNKSDLPVSPSISYNYVLGPKKNITFKISKEFRAPTSNELFWRPGGNVDLLPEIGWSHEVTYSQNLNKKGKLTAGLFHRKIDNWILWALNDLQFFQSTNIASVRSYGLDFSNVFNFKTSEINHSIGTNYAYVIAKNLKSVSSPNIAKGSQLFYKPIHKVTLDYLINYNDYFLNLNGQYISATVGTLDNLSGYELLNFNIKRTITIKNQSLDFSISINNLLNKQYRVIERRPMPGRNFNLGLTLNLTK